MKLYNFYSFFAACFLISPLYALNVVEGALMWGMVRHTTQWAPDIMITQNMVGSGGFTITSPGTYALSQNISFTTTDGIIIASNDVFFDLNGHTITGTGAGTTGINISPGFERITIKGGYIVNCGAVLFSVGAAISFVIIDQINADVGTTSLGTNGISALTNGDFVLIKNCTISQGNRGIAMGFGRNWIQNSIVADAVIGFSLGSSIVTDCTADTCTISGFSTLSSVAFCRCIAQGNSLNGTGFVNGFSGTQFIDCIAKTNGNIGFSNTGINSIFKNCYSENNQAAGFSNSAVNVTFDSCIAIANGQGGTDDGFSNSALNVTIKSCEAHGNTGIGINDTSGATFPNIFNDLSYNNTVANYSANVPAQVAASLVSSTTGVFWSNVTNP